MARSTRADPSEWHFDATPLSASLGAEIEGIDLARELSTRSFRGVYDAFLRHRVLLFRGQQLSEAGQVAFARLFGEVQVHRTSFFRAQGLPELYRLSNLDRDGKPSGRHPNRCTLAWHTDGSWRRRTGQATLLYAEQVPATGGETHFCDMYAAWDALSPERRARLESLRAVHSLEFTRRRWLAADRTRERRNRDAPPVDHPIARTHPETGRRCLFLGDHAEHVLGVDYDAGRALIDDLNARAIEPSRIYRHRWRPGELLVWDNRCLLHRATEYDAATQPRVMRRSTVLGDAPV